MSHGSGESMPRTGGRPGRRPGFGGVLAAGAVALGMAAAPVALDLDGLSLALTGKAALAGNGGGGGGGGSGGGGGGSGGGDRGDRGGDHGDRGGKGDRGSDHAGRGPGVSAGRDKGGEVDRPGRSGRGRSGDPHERAPELARARDRYNGVADDSRRGRGHAGFEREVGERAHAFSRAAVEGLIARGWRAEPRPDRFRNHGERVSTMVELAKRLGYGARVGAMQANFGTPQENDLADLQAALAEARARHEAGEPHAAAEVERLEAELRAAIEAAKPGRGPDDSWATADLDVNDDGTVDTRDLEALDQGAAAATAPADRRTPRAG